jgi:hypothetical protein
VKPTRLATVLATLLLSSCVLHMSGPCTSSGAYTVDGVELEHSHVETIALDALPPEGLHFDIGMGSIVVEPATDRSEVEVELAEFEPGDASARLERGRIVLTTKSGKPSAVKRVRARVRGTLSELRAKSGMGSVVVRDVAVAGTLALESGMGDVSVRGGSCADGSLSTGMGDVDASGLTCASLTGRSGMGDVSASQVVAKRASFHTGMGDVEVRRSTIDSIDANSGMGDVELVATSVESKELSAGMGDVEIRD